MLPARVDGVLARLDALRGNVVSDSARAAVAEVIAVMQGLRSDTDHHAACMRALLDARATPCPIVDAEGRIREANAAARTFYAYGAPALEELAIDAIEPDWYVEDARNEDQARHVRADGTRVAVTRRIVPFALEGTHWLLIEITPIESAALVRATSESFHGAFLKAIDQGVLVQDEHGTVAWANPAACRMLGMKTRELALLTREDLAGWIFLEADGTALDPRDLPGNIARRTGRSIDNTLVGVYIPHLHVYRWFAVNSVPDRDAASGRTRQVISIFNDVSELKREALMFRATQQLGKIGCWELDDLRGTLYWTEQLYHIHDLPPDSPLTEARTLAFFTPDSRRRVIEAVAAARRHGTSFELELEITTAIGRQRWIGIRGQALKRHGRIQGLIGTTQNIDERRAIEDRLRLQASIDPLTQLANRDAILAATDAAIERADSSDGPALLYIDLDRFKVLNDMLGHAAGDRLLHEVARRLVGSADENSIIGRYGNDEFLLLLHGAARAEHAEAVAARIVEAFAAPFQHAGERFALTVSVGVVAWPEGGTDTETLLRHADAAMLEAKRRGRNTWRAWRTLGEARAGDDHRLQIEAQLRLALDRDEFHLVYQPVIAFASGKVCGAEALLRWNSHVLGPQPPGAFIPFAEASGDIVRIGAWVIRQALAQLRRWRDQGIAMQYISVNVSYRQVLSGNLVDVVEAALKEHDLPGSALELEMTERVVIENVADTRDTFESLKRLGVALVIDDFGEGYSSLNYLRNLRLDGLKISHTFMRGVPGHSADEAICEAMVRIARSLGLRVVAEGVETEEQRRFLLALGTELAQGYLFARPQLASDIPACIDAINRASQRR